MIQGSCRIFVCWKEESLALVELADYLGLRRTYVSDLEHGKRNVSLLTLEVIARGFKLSVSQLMRGL